jgi:hypothetical protein
MYHTAERNLFRVPGTVRDDKTKRRLGSTPATHRSPIFNRWLFPLLFIQVKHNEFAAKGSLWTQPRVDPAPKRIDEPITLAIAFLDVYNAGCPVVLVLEGPLTNCFSRSHHSSRPIRLTRSTRLTFHLKSFGQLTAVICISTLSNFVTNATQHNDIVPLIALIKDIQLGI